MIFGKKHKNSSKVVAAAVAAEVQKAGAALAVDAAAAVSMTAAVALTGESNNAKIAPQDRAVNGPFDVTEVPSIRPYIDMGAIKLAPREGLQLRLDVDEASKRIVAVSIDYAGLTMQVQAFSAPKSTGIWQEVRAELKQNLNLQGAKVTERDGSFGGELLVTPIAGAPKNTRPIRFIGVDGPRWMLRAVIVGETAAEPQATEKIEAVFRELVVVRGDNPMPPKELLPLRIPAGATQEEASIVTAGETA